MNRTKIDWADWTWNPVTGCWGPGGSAENQNRCFYCYAERIVKCFKPRFHPERLDQPHFIKRPSRIFVCSMGDLFGDWVPELWISSVFGEAGNNPRHTFIFLTKNAKRLHLWNPWPANCWVGITIENRDAADERLPWLAKVQAKVRFVSFEPLLGSFAPTGVPWFKAYWGRRMVDWIIIGAMTGPVAKQHQPKPEWVQGLIDQGRAAGIPMFLKDNLKWPKKIQEWPDPGGERWLF